MPRFDTSFNFGANRKTRKPKPNRKPAKKRTGKRSGGSYGS